MPELNAVEPVAGKVRTRPPPMILPRGGLTRFLRARRNADDSMARWGRRRMAFAVAPVGSSRVDERRLRVDERDPVR